MTKKIVELAIMAILCLNFCAIAQENKAVDVTANGMHIGQQLPETFWQQGHTIYRNGQTSIQTLEQYKGKLLILDFWATWCSSCIKKFPLLDSLQKVYSNQLAIVLVNKLKTDRDTNKVKQAFGTHTKDLALATLVADEYLGQLFPHSILPHYVWLYNGKVVAITDSYEVSPAKINAVLQNGQLSIAHKADKIGFDYTKSFRENLGSGIDSVLTGTSLFLGYINGLVSGKNLIDNGRYKRYYFTNRPIISLYQFAFNQSFNRLIVELKNGKKLPTSPKQMGIKDEGINAYRKHNLFCYELVVPIDQKPEDDYAKMLADLNQFFHFNGRIEKRKMKCFVIEQKKHHVKLPETISAKDTDFIEVGSIRTLVHLLNYYTDIGSNQPIVVDETKGTAPINMLVPSSGMEDVKRLAQVLKAYGYTLKQKSRLIDMCVISE